MLYFIMVERIKRLNFGDVFPALFVGGLFLLNLLPILAPVLDYFGEKNFSSFIYRVYSFLCHQKALRSFFICDGQCGWCSRCTFIWFTTFLVAAFTFYPPFKKKEDQPLRSIGWKTAVLLVLPMALDGGIQLIAQLYSLWTGTQPIYESTNTIRAITGTLFGLGLGLYLFPKLREEVKR